VRNAHPTKQWCGSRVRTTHQVVVK